LPVVYFNVKDATNTVISIVAKWMLRSVTGKLFPVMRNVSMKGL